MNYTNSMYLPVELNGKFKKKWVVSVEKTIRKFREIHGNLLVSYGEEFRASGLCLLNPDGEVLWQFFSDKYCFDIQYITVLSDEELVVSCKPRRGKEIHYIQGLLSIKTGELRPEYSAGLELLPNGKSYILNEDRKRVEFDLLTREHGSEYGYTEGNFQRIMSGHVFVKGLIDQSEPLQIDYNGKDITYDECINGLVRFFTEDHCCYVYSGLVHKEKGDVALRVINLKEHKIELELTCDKVKKDGVDVRVIIGWGMNENYYFVHCSTWSSSYVRVLEKNSLSIVKTFDTRIASGYFNITQDRLILFGNDDNGKGCIDFISLEDWSVVRKLKVLGDYTIFENQLYHARGKKITCYR